MGRSKHYEPIYAYRYEVTSYFNPKVGLKYRLHQRTKYPSDNLYYNSYVNVPRQYERLLFIKDGFDELSQQQYLKDLYEFLSMNYRVCQD